MIVSTRERYIVIILFILAVLMSVPALFHPMVGEADAYERVLIAWKQWQVGAVGRIGQNYWLPVHFVLLEVGIALFGDKYFGPRMITVLFSAGTIVYLYLVAQRASGSTRAAVIAAILMLLFPLRAILATQTLAEPIYCFFVIGSFYYAIQNKMFMSILFLSAALGMRYEGWFLIIPYSVLPSIFRKTSVKNMFLYAVGYSSVPIGLMTASYYLFHSPFIYAQHMYELGRLNVLPEYLNILRSTGVRLGHIMAMVSPIGVASVLIYGKNLLDKKHNTPVYVTALIGIAIYQLVILIILTLLGLVQWHHVRYVYVICVCLLPAIAHIFDRIFKGKKPLMIASLVAGTIFFYPAWYQQVHEELTSHRFGNGNVGVLEVLELAAAYTKERRFVKDAVVTYVLPENIWQSYWTEHAFYYFAGIGLPNDLSSYTTIKCGAYYVHEIHGESAFDVLDPRLSIKYKTEHLMLLRASDHCQKEL